MVASRLTGVAGVGGLAWCWVHALVARLHRYLIATILVLARLRMIATALGVEDLVAVNLPATKSATLHAHGVRLVYHSLHRIILFVGVYEGIQFMFICLILKHFDMILR